MGRTEVDAAGIAPAGEFIWFRIDSELIPIWFRTKSIDTELIPQEPIWIRMRIVGFELIPFPTNWFRINSVLE